MRLHPRQIESVLGLPGPKRYEHFIKRVADTGVAWGLYLNGWALAETDDDRKGVFPLWPAEEYAHLCAKGDWDGFQPRSIPVEELLDDLLPNLENEGLVPGVFWRPDGKTVIPTIAELIDHLREELEKYE